MKIKTSVSLEESTIEKIKQAASLEDRSHSYFIEKVAGMLAAAADRGEKLGDALERMADALDKKSSKSK